MQRPQSLPIVVVCWPEEDSLPEITLKGLITLFGSPRNERSFLPANSFSIGFCVRLGKKRTMSHEEKYTWCTANSRTAVFATIYTISLSSNNQSPYSLTSACNCDLEEDNDYNNPQQRTECSSSSCVGRLYIYFHGIGIGIVTQQLPQAQERAADFPIQTLRDDQVCK